MTDHSSEFNKLIARELLRSEGIDVTPDEVAACRKLVHAKLREGLRALGYDVPDGEVEFTAWMQEVLGNP